MNEMMNGICPACFRAKMLNGLCPACGYILSRTEEQQKALPWYSVLHGAYQTGRVLGVGGFGITYAARSMNSGTLCCIKEHVPESLVTGRDYRGNLIVPKEHEEEFDRGRERFLEEARILKQLQNNVTVVNIWDFFEQNKTAYFVMEYLDGDNMRVFQQKHTSQRAELTSKALEMVLAVGSALIEVHRFGLIHGDISPENIILTNNGEMKLIDFGAARMFGGGADVRQGKIYLKSGYAPYEQHSTKGRIGPWTDVYSLAATYYALVTGHKIPDARDRVKADTYQPLSVMCPDLNRGLTQVIDRALAVDYRERYQTMKEFLNEISAGTSGKTAGQSLPHTPTEMTDASDIEEPKPLKKKGFRLFGRKKTTSANRGIYLELYTRAGSVYSWALQEDVIYTVGRHPSSHIVLPPDERLSRNHCTICYVSSKNYLLLTDYSSRGTYLEGGERLPKEETVRVGTGEYFYMAVPDFRFRVVEDEEW